MQQYELLVVLPGTMTDEEAATAKEQLSTIITSFGATNITADDKGKSRIAYPMKHIRYGYFFFFHFEAEPKSIPAIQEKIRLTTKTLRSIVTRYDADMQEKKQSMLSRLSEDRPVAAAKDVEEDVVEVPVVETPPVVPPEPTEEVVEEAPKPAKKKEKTPVTMEEIDEKLNEILDGSL